MSTKCPKCDFDNPETQKFCGECGTQLTPAESIPEVTKTLETLAHELHGGSVFAHRYEILEKLGSGGMGEVYRVKDKKLDEVMALKVLRPEIAAHKVTIERFKNELKLARKIAHRNVCKMFDLHEEEETPFITMEYVEGEDLKKLIRRKGKLSEKEAIAIAKQVCGGLAEAHELGVIHRDLKPQNIMIDEKGTAKVMDFGIARSVEAAGVTQTGVMIGTPDYISPEQAEGEEADHRSDIYSLGVILYEMVTGRLPFKGDTALSVALKHKAQLPADPKKLNPQLSNNLGRLILVCMEKDRERRYQTAAELLADLRNIEEGFPLGTKIRPRKRTLASALMRRKILTPALVVLVAIIAILIWVFLPRTKVTPIPKIENSIAVISFENLTGDPQYDGLIKAVPNLLITKFESMGFSYVETWERQQDILKQMGKDRSAAVDTDLGFEICRRDGIAALAVGRITKAGDVFATDLKILDVETKKSLISATSSGDGVGSILKFQIDELSMNVAQGLGWNVPEAKKAPPISEVTTSSNEAYQCYLSGVSALDKYYREEASKHLLKAVELDPEFASAYLELAKAYSGLSLLNKRNEAIEKAFTLIDKANPKEKLYIKAFHAYYFEKNQDNYIQILKQIAKNYPKEKQAHYYLGRIYDLRAFAFGETWDESLRELHAAVDLDPFYGVALNLIAYIYRDKGENDKALEYAKRYVDASPNEAQPFDTLGDFYCGFGQFDLAIEQFKKALNIKHDFGMSLWNMSYTYALKEEYDEAIKWAEEYCLRVPPSHNFMGYILKAFYEYWTGSYKKALDDLEDLWIEGKLYQREKIGGGESKAHYHNMKSWVFLAHGDFESYREEMKQSSDAWIGTSTTNTKFNHDIWKEILSAYSECLEGKPGDARGRLTKVENLLVEFQDNQQPENANIKRMLEYLRVKILFTEGSWEEAISKFEQLSPTFAITSGTSGRIIDGNTMFYHEMDLAYAYEMKGEMEKAIAVLEDIVRFDSADSDLRLTPPKVYYNLGRLYEKMSMKERAKENYAKFLDLWKDADAGLPELGDAKARLAALQRK